MQLLLAVQDLVKRFREFELGGRLFSGTFGSAPAAPDVIQWLEEVLGFPPVNGYGSTEGGMIMLDNKIQRRCAAAQHPISHTTLLSSRSTAF